MQNISSKQDTSLQDNGKILSEELKRFSSFGVSQLIPIGSADTTPRYSWRGVMLDSARTFWPVSTVCELLALMARYRLNTLHWHLCDDAGWRFTVADYPKLTTIGATLKREEFMWYTNVDPQKAAEAYKLAPSDSASGYYTDDELRLVVDYAHSLGIQIIPEVDLPGHMGAAIRAYPELGDPALAKLPAAQWTHRNDVLWPSEKSTNFIHAALDKITNIFPSKIVHIGADEVNFAAWEADANLMHVAAQSSLDSGAQIQGEFIAQARAHLAKSGHRLAIWDDALEAHADVLSGNEVVTAWQGNESIKHAINSGHDWIFADSSLLYLNHVAGPVDSEPAGMFDGISVADILAASIPANDHLLGVQAAIWCEFIPTRDLLYYHLFPRLLAVAQIAWSNEKVSWSDFNLLLKQEVEWLISHGINARPIDSHTYQVIDPVVRKYRDLPIDRHQAPEALRAKSGLIA